MRPLRRTAVELEHGDVDAQLRAPVEVQVQGGRQRVPHRQRDLRREAVSPLRQAGEAGKAARRQGSAGAPVAGESALVVDAAIRRDAALAKQGGTIVPSLSSARWLVGDPG